MKSKGVSKNCRNIGGNKGTSGVRRKEGCEEGGGDRAVLVGGGKKEGG